MTQLQQYYDNQSKPVQVLVVDILESMAITKQIQRTYGIEPPCLNDQPGTVWSAYHWDNYIPSNFVIQRDQDQTLFYRAHTMTLSSMEYWIDQALAVNVAETPATTVKTTLKTSSISRNRVAINYSLQNRRNIKLTVYNTSGKLVTNLTQGLKNSGYYTTNWYPKQNGIYFVRLNVEGQIFTAKVVILK